MNENIEKDIRSLCEKFNSINGFETIYSCHGHPMERKKPYIIFLSSVQDAGKLDNLLSSAQQTGSLFYTWWITANFDKKQNLQFKLETNDNRVSKCTKILPLNSWSHQHIIKDFNMIEELLSLNF